MFPIRSSRLYIFLCKSQFTPLFLQPPLYSFVKIAIRVSVFATDPIHVYEKRKSCFQISLMIATGSGKMAFLFQFSLMIATGSGKTAFLFQFSHPIATGSGKMAFLFQIKRPTLHTFVKIACRLPYFK